MHARFTKRPNTDMIREECLCILFKIRLLTPFSGLFSLLTRDLESSTLRLDEQFQLWGKYREMVPTDGHCLIHAWLRVSVLDEN